MTTGSTPAAARDCGKKGAGHDIGEDPWLVAIRHLNGKRIAEAGYVSCKDEAIIKAAELAIASLERTGADQ